MPAATSAVPRGANFHSTDVDYAILARLVEVTSRMPFDQYLAAHVLHPLGMTHTTSTSTAGQAQTSSPLLPDGHIMLFGVPVSAAS